MCEQLSDIVSTLLLDVFLHSFFQIGRDIPKEACTHFTNIQARLQSEKKEKSDDSSMEPIVIWQCVAVSLALVLILTLFLTFRRKNPSKKKCDVHVVQVINEKLGENV